MNSLFIQRGCIRDSTQRILAENGSIDVFTLTSGLMYREGRHELSHV